MTERVRCGSEIKITGQNTLFWNSRESAESSCHKLNTFPLLHAIRVSTYRYYNVRKNRKNVFTAHKAKDYLIFRRVNSGAC